MSWLVTKFLRPILLEIQEHTNQIRKNLYWNDDEASYQLERLNKLTDKHLQNKNEKIK